MQCQTCGAYLAGEELESPRLDSDGDQICDECYTDHYQITCVKCENYYDKIHQGAIGSLFVAMSEQKFSIEDGIYKVVSHPFYANGLIEASLYKDAVEQVSGETFGVNPYPYPMGFLCPECQIEIEGKIKKIALKSN